MFQYANADKNMTSKFVDLLDQEDKTQLLKFFYMTYERFTIKKDCKTLKPMKLYKIHQEIVEKDGIIFLYFLGIGCTNRSLFNVMSTK